jgi:DNA-binding CsgD family transcriptional regulator
MTRVRRVGHSGNSSGSPNGNEILCLGGLGNAEIAGRLVISPLTGKTHVNRLLGKLGCRDRAPGSSASPTKPASSPRALKNDPDRIWLSATGCASKYHPGV